MTRPPSREEMANRERALREIREGRPTLVRAGKLPREEKPRPTSGPWRIRLTVEDPDGTESGGSVKVDTRAEVLEQLNGGKEFAEMVKGARLYYRDGLDRKAKGEGDDAA